jgi:hypothetical protein
MAIATLDDYKRALTSGRFIVPFSIASVTTSAGVPFDLWMVSPPVPPLAPTTAAVPTKDTAGALPIENAGGGLQNSIVGFRLTSFNPGALLVADRLSHTGGLSATVTTPQTTNLPTAALTRYTDGVGVMMALTIYTLIGTTATTVSATYTNQAGVGSRVTPLVPFGGTRNREANRMIFLPLQSGDTGVRSVESVTVTATTGTAGNFGVTLFRLLQGISIESLSGVGAGGFVSGWTVGGIPRVEPDACLFLVSVNGYSNPAAAGALIMEEH